MKLHFSKTVVCAILLAVVALSACGPSKADKLKYNNDIIGIVAKADTADAQATRRLEPLMQSPSVENYTAALAEVAKLETELKAAKTALAAIPAPKFEELNMKSSTDKWLDASITGLADQKLLLESLVKGLKAQGEVQAAGGEEAASEELKAAVAQYGQESMNIAKKVEEYEATLKTLRETILSNAAKFTSENGLK